MDSVHFGKWKHKCGLCEELFDQKDEIKSHRAKVHTTKTIKKEATFEDTTDSGAKGSKKKIAPKICDICGKTVYGLTTHRKNHHESINENIACPECGNTYR